MLAALELIEEARRPGGSDGIVKALRSLGVPGIARADAGAAGVLDFLAQGVPVPLHGAGTSLPAHGSERRADRSRYHLLFAE
jgi:hypothetical protein